MYTSWNQSAKLQSFLFPIYLVEFTRGTPHNVLFVYSKIHALGNFDLT